MWRLARPDAALALNDPKVKAGMPRYVEVVKGANLAKFIIARSMYADFNHGDSTDDLWQLHGQLLERYVEFEQQADKRKLSLEDIGDGPSFLDLKVELGRRMMTNCHFCVRRCSVDRLAGERGYCNCGVEFAISSCFPHTGEEPELVPSGTIFTCGCSIRCIHCQNWSISQWREQGTAASPDRVVEVVESLRKQGCRNVNMVGGDPTPNCWLWLQTMRGVEASIATVWNSNSFYSQETAELLAGFIDLYLLDFKYGNNEHAKAISDAPGYWEAVTRNHMMGKEYGELLIRVLILPEHNKCCTRPILKWIAKNLSPWTRVNVMFQYRPEYRAQERKELGRRLTRQEKEEALKIAKEAGLKNLVH
jgi:putative pyruvate formate lyase activating enzyme